MSSSLPDMPWCDACQGYHHSTAECFKTTPKVWEERAYYNDITFETEGLYAGKCEGMKVCIKAGHNYNGSGKEYFGGAMEWPAIQIRIAFQALDYAGRDKFVEDFKAFWEKWQRENPNS